jgi:ribonuclease Z
MSRQTFELLVLGCSSASPTATRNPSAQLLNIAERFFLIDCGEGTQIQLRKFRARFQGISQIFISHLHGDHFFGLPGLLSSMHLLGRKQPVIIYAPPGLRDVCDRIFRVSESWLSFPVIWKETENTGLTLLFEDEKVEVHSFPVRHRIFCTGFLFREKPLERNINKQILKSMDISIADIHRLKKGMDVTDKYGRLISNVQATIDPPAPRSYAYCTDTLPDETIVEFIRNADLLYHESTFLEDNRERAQKTYHSTAADAARMAKISGAKKLLLGHYSARYPDSKPFLEEAGVIFPDCLLAEDGKKIII